MRPNESLSIYQKTSAVQPYKFEELAQNSKTIKLRDYQKPMVAGTYRLIRDGVQKILMVAIMGSGKTVIASWIMRDAVSKGKRCVFLVALNVLRDKTTETLRELGVNCTVLQGDRPIDESAPVIIASLQTIGARLRRGKSLGSDEAINQFTAVYGHTPPSEWLIHACLTKRYSQKPKADFVSYLERHCNIQSRWAGQWLDHHLRIEFGTADVDQLELFLQWHHILEVEPNADWATIKQAYSAKVEEFNPDHYPGSNAEACIERLNLALEDARLERTTIGQPIAVGGAE